MKLRSPALVVPGLMSIAIACCAAAPTASSASQPGAPSAPPPVNLSEGLTLPDGSHVAIAPPSTPGCKQLPLIAQRWERPDRTQKGIALPTPAPDSATVALFQDPNGGQVSTPIPPRGWSPQTASAAELDYYGYPSRPSDAQSLSAWITAAKAFHGFGSPGLCEDTTYRNAPLPTPPATSPTGSYNTSVSSSNYAGVYNGATNISKVYARRVNTGYNSGTCASNAEHSAWVGIGGFGGNPLIQNGVLDRAATRSRRSTSTQAAVTAYPR